MGKMVLTVFIISIVLASGAMSQNKSDWIFREVEYGTGTPDMSASLSYDDGIVLKIDSSDSSTGVFKLSTIIHYPQGDDWELTVKVRVTAPDIDLDHNNNYLIGTPDEEGEDNDGPNFFAFVYGYPDATVEKPGFTLRTQSFLPYPQTSNLCHLHFECNWAGSAQANYGFYCSSGSETGAMKPGWIADGPNLGFSGGYSLFDGEAFTSGEWKTIKLNVDGGECMYHNLSIVFMGADAFTDSSYTWEIKDIVIKGEVTEGLSLETAYDMSEGEYMAKPAYCGNGVKDEGEECDGEEVPSGFTCFECKVESVCGDGIVVEGEVCDSSSVTRGYRCSTDCLSETPVCGDGIIVDEEVCDPEAEKGTGNYTEGWNCSSDCKSLSPICGDGIVVGKEECDGTTGLSSNYTACTDVCTIYRLLSSEEEITVTQIFSLAKQAAAGDSSSIGLNFTGTGSIGLEDLEEQEALREITDLPANHSFHLCVAGTTVCEEDYIIKGKVTASDQTLSFKQTKGTLKIYAIDTNGTIAYYIGYKSEGPDALVDEGTGMFAVAIGSLLLIAFLLLIVGGVVFWYVRKMREPKKKKRAKKREEEE